MMCRTLILMSLLPALIGCKPTPRTVPHPQQNTPTEEQKPAAAEQAAEQPATAPEVPQQTQQTPRTAWADSILNVRCARQSYDPLQPWQKGEVSKGSALGVYLGDGQVLVSGGGLAEATYLELALPDGSATSPARLLKWDEDLQLGLLTTEQGAEDPIFANRCAVQLGDAPANGEPAELVGLADGLNPFALPLQPRSSAGYVLSRIYGISALPGGHTDGAPVMIGDKLVGLTSGYDEDKGLLTVTTADELKRFLAEETVGVVKLGVHLGSVEDPLFRRYLRLPQGAGGVYVAQVTPGGAGEQSGLREGDVITAIDGVPIDTQGRCDSPIYGRCDALALLRTEKPLGGSAQLTICRGGETQELTLPLNRDITTHGTEAEPAPGSAPHYIVWGGLLFQPLNADYIAALKAQMKDLPLPILRTVRASERGENAEVKEPVALTMVIPTPATLSYDRARFSVVTAVNGKPVHDLAELAQLLDEPTPDGLAEISLNAAPYHLYIDRAAAEQANDRLRRTAIPKLRVLEDEKPE